MGPFLIFKLATLFFWCHAAVLTVAWFRAVGAEDQRTHVGHFVGLMGVFVPVAALAIASLMLAAMLHFALPLTLLVILLPAGLVIGLHLEVSQIAGSNERSEWTRLAAATGLASCVWVVQGGA